MTGDEHNPDPGAPDVREHTSADRYRGAPGTAQPPARPSFPRAPGAAAVLTEIADELAAYDQRDPGWNSDRDLREWISHIARLLTIARYCDQTGLPSRRVVLAIAVQAAGELIALEDRP